jgi:hypothetical protein
VLRHHVKEIVFITNKLPRYDEIDDFARHFPTSNMLQWAVKPTDPHATAADQLAWDRHQWPEGKLTAAWRYYQELCDQQEDQRTSSDGWTLVREAFAKLSKLRSIQIRRFTSEGGPMPYLWPVSEYTIYSTNLLSEMPNVFSSTNRHLESILTAALAAKTPIEDLSVVDLDARLFLHENPSFNDIRQSIENLRRIHLQIEIEEQDDSDSWDDCRRDLARGGLGQILHTARQLDSMDIIFPFVAVEDPVASLSGLFNGMDWRRLSRVRLVGIETTSEALISFIETHAKSLKDLQLEHFKLVGQDIHGWHEIFTSIDASLHLEDARFTGYFTADLADGFDIDYIDMADDIRGVSMTVGEALEALMCHSPLATEEEMRRETFEDLLKHGLKRLASSFRMEIPLRHPEFLCSLQP